MHYSMVEHHYIDNQARKTFLAQFLGDWLKKPSQKFNDVRQYNNCVTCWKHYFPQVYIDKYISEASSILVYQSESSEDIF